MWGQKWGQLVWGRIAAAPALPAWGILLLGAALFLLTLRLLRARSRTIGLAALVLAFAVPLTAHAISLPFTFTNGTVADATQINANFAALAAHHVYGFVNADGTLDPSLNGGIIDVQQPQPLSQFPGYYCFKLGFTAKSAIGSADAGANRNLIVTTFVQHGGFVGLSGCPTGYNDATAIVRDANGGIANGAFYITFE